MPRNSKKKKRFLKSKTYRKTAFPHSCHFSTVRRDSTKCAWQWRCLFKGCCYRYHYAFLGKGSGRCRPGSWWHDCELMGSEQLPVKRQKMSERRDSVATFVPKEWYYREGAGKKGVIEIIPISHLLTMAWIKCPTTSSEDIGHWLPSWCLKQKHIQHESYRLEVTLGKI